MRRPVHGGLPRVADGLVELAAEVAHGLRLAAVQHEGVAQVVQVPLARQLRDARRQHHGEQGDDEGAAATQDGEGPFAVLLEPGWQIENILLTFGQAQYLDSRSWAQCYKISK